jgi:hypothetical protein
MITGYFASTAEMVKLVQSKLLAGVVQEIYEVGQLIPHLPVTTIDSYTLKWNREGELPSVSAKAKGEQYGWQEVATYSDTEVALKEYGDQWALPKGAQETYKDPNDYRAVIQAQIIKGALRTIEDQLIYGDATTYPKQMNGLDKLCAATAAHTFASYQDYDMGGGTIGLSIKALLGCMHACKPRPSFFLMPQTIVDQLFIYSMGKAGAIVMARSPSEFGTLIDTVNGVPIVVSDYLTTETDNTGGKSATALVSIYAIRTGSIEDGGVSLVVGGKTGGRDFFEVDHFDKLESYNAEGIRAYCYVALAMGSTKSVARVHSICQTTAIDATS